MIYDSRVKSESFALELRGSMSMVSFQPTTDSYDVWSHLGTVCGGMGSVRIATHKAQHNTQLAVKIYELDKCQEELELIQHEISTVRKLRHPNIIHYLTSFITEQQLWIIMPLMGYFSASRLVASHFPEGLPEQALALVIKDVLQGMVYLHSKGIIHRSIRGSHILVDSNGRCVLSGMRHCISVMDAVRWHKAIHSYPAQAAFNLNWASPELLEQDLMGYTEKSDIYSLGIAVCELGNGEVPYSNIPSTLMLVEKLEGRIPFLYDASTTQLFLENGQGFGGDSGVGGSVGDNMINMAYTHRQFSQWAHDFVYLCLTREPEHRPSAQQCLQHQFIRQTRKLNVSLPHLLHPVVPLTHQAESGDTDADLLETNLEHLNLNDDFTWDF